ncbi:MAG: C39 family peptidase [Candidatus Ozemobacteraceae bacterium]
MKKNFTLVVILGWMLLGNACNLFSPAQAQTPFSDGSVTKPLPTAVNTALNEAALATTASGIASAAVSQIASGTIPGQLASDSAAASMTRSLWADLHRLYKESDAGRIGKRVFKKTQKITTEHHLPGFDDLQINIKGDNYCGQFAMSTLLNGMGIKTDPQVVYQKTNPAGIFTAPPTIVEHLRMSGIDAKMKNKASVSDVTKRIDEGKPVMVLVDSGDGTPHWICITGYDTNDKGQIESIRMRDSYWGTNGPHTMNVKDFEKAWKSPFGTQLLGNFVGYSNLLIDNNGTCEPTSAPPIYPGTFSTATEDNLTGGINDVVTGYKNHSIAQTTGGVAKLLLGLPGEITGLASNYINTKSQDVVNWGKEKKKQEGLGNKVLGAAAIVGGRLTNGVAKTSKGIADAWCTGTSIIGNGIKDIGSWF